MGLQSGPSRGAPWTAKVGFQSEYFGKSLWDNSWFTRAGSQSGYLGIGAGVQGGVLQARALYEGSWKRNGCARNDTITVKRVTTEDLINV